MIRVNSQPSDCIKALDRGLMYGDGVFRTLLVRNGRLLDWPRHYAKLQSDCSALGIQCPLEAVLAGEAEEITRAEPDCVLKIVVTRGEGRRGYAISDNVDPTYILITSVTPSYPDHYYTNGVKVHQCTLRLSHQPRLAGVKHLNRLENVLARQEWDDPQIAEGLLMDQAGNVIEGTMSNVFMFLENALWTPDLSQCGVAGVQRDRIIEAAKSINIPVIIEAIPMARLLQAEELFLCNSIFGIWPVEEFAGKSWHPGQITALLSSQLQNDREN